MANPNLRSKVVFIGRSQSGKTVRAMRLSNQNTYNHYVPTLGVDVSVCENYTIWDTAGQPRYGGLADGYMLGASAVVVFDGGNKTPENDALLEMYLRRMNINCPGAAIVHHKWHWTVDELHEQIMQALHAG